MIVGHDWGALVAWHMAQLHPDRVRAVIGVSVPYTAWPAAPTALLKAMWGDRFFYILYFQEVGPAERELGADIRRTMHHTLWAASGEMYQGVPTEFLPVEGTGFLDAIAHGVGPVPDDLPSWLTTADLDTYVETLHRQRVLRTAQLVPQPRRQLRAHQGHSPPARSRCRASSSVAATTW